MRFVLSCAAFLAAVLSVTALASAERRPPHVIKIYKAERRMTLEVAGELVRAFRIGLGGAPRGDKVQRGDQRTPEGRFYVTVKNPRSSFHRFIGLSYPMPRHAEQGLANKLISKAHAKQIHQRVRRRGAPPQTTRLGGHIGIHGGGSSSDWTLGCIAVSDEEAEWLFSRLRWGDRIEVYP